MIIQLPWQPEWNLKNFFILSHIEFINEIEDPQDDMH